MRIGLLLPSIYMHDRFGKGRIFAPGIIGKTLADGLVERGHEVYFYTAPGVKSNATVIEGDESLLLTDPIYYLFRNREEMEKKYTTIEIQKRDFEYVLTLKIYKDALKGRFDIIHSYHDFGAHYFNDLTGFPTVYTLHDPMPVSDNTIEYHRLKRFSQHCYVSISNAQRKDFPINFVSTVYHGIDLDQYISQEGKGGYLIHFGRILEDKGTHIAIDVAKRAGIPIHIATSSVRANISRAYYEGKIKPQVDGLRVIEVGYLEEKEKSDYIGNGIAFLFPLQWDEPFGMVMIEAMACGTPVIAYNRGSVSEIVRDGLTGFIVDPPEADQQVQSSIHSTSSGQEFKVQNEGQWVIKKRGVEGLIEAVKRIGEIDRKACRKHVEENFSIGRMVEGYEKVYKKVIEATRPTFGT